MLKGADTSTSIPPEGVVAQMFQDMGYDAATRKACGPASIPARGRRPLCV